jgi:hypothetical protein
VRAELLHADEQTHRLWTDRHEDAIVASRNFAKESNKKTQLKTLIRLYV